MIGLTFSIMPNSHLFIFFKKKTTKCFYNPKHQFSIKVDHTLYLFLYFLPKFLFGMLLRYNNFQVLFDICIIMTDVSNLNNLSD